MHKSGIGMSGGSFAGLRRLRVVKYSIESPNCRARVDLPASESAAAELSGLSRSFRVASNSD